MAHKPFNVFIDEDEDWNKIKKARKPIDRVIRSMEDEIRTRIEQGPKPRPPVIFDFMLPEHTLQQQCLLKQYTLAPDKTANTQRPSGCSDRKAFIGSTQYRALLYLALCSASNPRMAGAVVDQILLLPGANAILELAETTFRAVTEKLLMQCKLETQETPDGLKAKFTQPAGISLWDIALTIEKVSYNKRYNRKDGQKPINFNLLDKLAENKRTRRTPRKEIIYEFIPVLKGSKNMSRVKLARLLRNKGMRLTDPYVVAIGAGLFRLEKGFPKIRKFYDVRKTLKWDRGDLLRGEKVRTGNRRTVVFTSPSNGVSLGSIDQQDICRFYYDDFDGYWCLEESLPASACVK